jgi:hypothetical protein
MKLIKLHEFILGQTQELRKQEIEDCKNREKKSERLRLYAILVFFLLLAIVIFCYANFSPVVYQIAFWASIAVSGLSLLYLGIKKKIFHGLWEITFYEYQSEASTLANEICKKFIVAACEKSIPHFLDYCNIEKENLDEHIKKCVLIRMQFEKFAYYDQEKLSYNPFSIPCNFAISGVEVTLKSITVDSTHTYMPNKVGVHFILETKEEKAGRVKRSTSNPTIIFDTSETRISNLSITILLDESEIVYDK